MNLILDFGNSSVKAGIFEATDLLRVYDRMQLDQLPDIIDGTSFENIFASTVGAAKHEITAVLGRDIRFLEPDTPLPFRNAYRTPETLGRDRLAGVAGAQEIFPGETALVIDIGTCITYDLITSGNVYEGGAISPGLDIRFRSLHAFTAGLPLVEYVDNPDLIGKSTRDSILSGVIYGMQAEIEGFIRYYKDKYGDLKIILCGGGSKIFENRLKQAIFAAPDLVLRGLNRILRYNVS